MRLNPVSLIFVPGAILAGYLIDGGYGALIGLVLWTVVVSVATCISLLLRRNRRKKFDDATDESEPPKAPQILPRVFTPQARR